MVLHRSLAHKMDYHLSLCYPSDIAPIAKYIDSVLWSVLERASGQHVPRKEEEFGFECVLDIPVDSMAGHSFQDLLVRSPIKLRGFGLRSLADTAPVAFIGAAELALPSFSGEKGVCRQLENLVGHGSDVGDSWWKCLLKSNCQTAREFAQAWDIPHTEAVQCCNYLGCELTGALSRGPANSDENKLGESSCQSITEQREE